MKRRREMWKRKELVKATKLRARAVRFSFYVDCSSVFRGRRSRRSCLLRPRRRWRWRRLLLFGAAGVRLAWSLGRGGGVGGLGILRRPRIFFGFRVFGGRRGPKARRAGNNVQQSSNVRSGALFVVVLCQGTNSIIQKWNAIRMFLRQQLVNGYGLGIPCRRVRTQGFNAATSTESFSCGPLTCYDEGPTKWGSGNLELESQK